MSFFPSVAFLTDSAGAGEWIVLFVVILVVIGPKRMPEVARKIGRMMEMFRRAADEFRDQLMTMDQEPHVEKKPEIPAGGGESTDHSYSDAYAGSSDYPGNEEHVENWHAEATAESAAEPSAPPASERNPAADVGGQPVPKAPEGQA